MKKRTLDDLWNERLNDARFLESRFLIRDYTEPLNKLFQEARSRENRWRNGIIITVIGLIGIGIAYSGAKYRSIQAWEVRDQQICVQSAEQQDFSPDLCSDDCFRDAYFELQRKYKIEDMGLVYKITTKKCEGKR